MQQQHIELTHNQLKDQGTNNINDNCFQLKRKLKRKISQICKRVAKQPQHKLTDIAKSMEKYTQTKGKVYRKDTLETRQTLTDSNIYPDILPKNQKIDELIVKSSKDPFVKRKLKAIMENDLKNLMKLNQRNLTMSQKFGSHTERELKNTLDSLASSQIIESEYKHIPKDISMILNKSVILRRSDPGKKVQQKNVNSEERIFQDFTDQESKIMQNNQKVLNQEFTTLRKESYRNKVARLESLRSVEQKQRAITEMALARFIDKTNMDKYGHIKKNSFAQKKQKFQK